MSKELNDRIAILRAYNVDGTELEEAYEGILNTVEHYDYCFTEKQNADLLDIVEEALKDYLIADYVQRNSEHADQVRVNLDELSKLQGDE